MKKNFTVNISGIIFHIDEDAYEKLNNYFSSIRKHFSGEDSHEEICNDIESRVAEMLQDKISESKTVINITDVEEVIAVMGQPFEFSEEEKEEKHSKERYVRGSKRLYRDPDEKVLGGVAGGMGAYFNTDPLWFRLAFVVSFFFAGPLLYILFWLVVPAAKSTAEKLEMRGEPVNVSTIEKSIREELNHLADKLKDLKNDGEAAFKKKVKTNETGFEKLVDVSIVIARYFMKAFIILLGISFIVLSLTLAIPFIASMFSPSAVIDWGPNAHWISLPGIFDILYLDSRDKLMALAGLCFFFGIPLIMLMYHGIKLLFGIKWNSRVIGLTAFGLWLFGIVLSSVASVRLLNDFRIDSRTEKITVINTPPGNIYHLKVAGENWENDNTFHHFHFEADNPRGVFSRYPEFDIRKSKDSTARIISYYYARGMNEERAREYSHQVEYPLVIEDSMITLPHFFHLNKDSKWRAQKVRLVLEIPEGSRIKADSNIDRLIGRTDNWFNFPSDFGGNTWLMTTDDGLVSASE